MSSLSLNLPKQWIPLCGPPTNPSHPDVTFSCTPVSVKNAEEKEGKPKVRISCNGQPAWLRKNVKHHTSLLFPAQLPNDKPCTTESEKHDIVMKPLEDAARYTSQLELSKRPLQKLRNEDLDGLIRAVYLQNKHFVPDALSFVSEVVEEYHDAMLIKSDTNWLHNGSNMSAFWDAGDPILLYPGGKNLEILKARKAFSMEEPEFDSHSLKGGMIYQITTPQSDALTFSSSFDHTRKLFLVRQLKKVSLWRYDNSVERVCLLPNASQDSRLVHATLNPVIQGDYAVTNEDGILLHGSAHERMQPSVTENVVNAEHPWSQLNFGAHPRTLLIAQRNKVELTDLRTEFKPSSIWEEPTEIISACHSINNYSYVATSRHLLLIDGRFAGSPLFKLKHNLTVRPECISVNNNFVVLYCRKGYGCFTFLDWEHKYCQSLPKYSRVVNVCPKPDDLYTFPCTRPLTLLPSFASSLHEFKDQAYCLNPLLQNRLRLSVTGLATLSAETGVDVFLSNASGDIWMQQINQEEAKYPWDKLKTWEREAKDLKLETTWNATSVLEIGDLRNKLANTEAPAIPCDPLPLKEYVFPKEYRKMSQALDGYTDSVSTRIKELWAGKSLNDLPVTSTPAPEVAELDESESFHVHEASKTYSAKDKTVVLSQDLESTFMTMSQDMFSQASVLVSSQQPQTVTPNVKRTPRRRNVAGF